MLIKLCICCIVTKKEEDYFDRNEINTYIRILRTKHLKEKQTYKQHKYLKENEYRKRQPFV